MDERKRPLRPRAVADAMFAAKNGPQVKRLPTGFHTIDERCGKVAVGEMALMWARSGSGKSTWMLNVIGNTPEIPTAVFNMEMRPALQLQWLAAITQDLPVDYKELEEALADPDHYYYEAVGDAVRRIDDFYPDLRFFQEDRPTVADLDEMVQEASADIGEHVERVFIDHLELLEGAGGYQELKQVTGDLHSWAQHRGLALYVMQQTTRGGGDRGKNNGHMLVTLSDGVFSGEQDADFIYGLSRPSADPEFRKSPSDYAQPSAYNRMEERRRKAYNKAVLQVIKNRPFGELCEQGILLDYHPASHRLEEITEGDIA